MYLLLYYSSMSQFFNTVYSKSLKGVEPKRWAWQIFMGKRPGDIQIVIAKLKAIVPLCLDSEF